MKTKQTLAQAYQHHQANRFGAAEGLYRTVLAQDKKNGTAWHLLGLLLHQTGRSEAALEALRQAVALEPRQALYHQSLGLVYLEAEQLEPALASYEAMVHRAPQDGQGHFMVGQLKLALGRYAEAVLSLKRAVTLQSGLAAGWLALARAYQEVGDLAHAQQAYRQVIQLDAGNLDGLYGLGLVSLRLGEYEAAAEYLTAVVKQDPTRSEAQRQLGLLLKRRGDYQGAEERFKQAIQADQHNAAAYNNLGTLYGEQGAYTEAVAQLRRATRLQPDFAQAYYNLGLALHQQGELPQAAAAFDQAARLEPGNPSYHYHAGAIRLQQGKEGFLQKADIEAGVVSLRRAVQLNPNYAEAYYGLGVMLRKLEIFSEAQDSFQTAIALKPDYVEAYYGLGQLAADLSAAQGYSEETMQQAINYFQQALLIKPDYAEAHYKLGLTYSRMHQVELAQQSYQRAIQLAPENKLWQIESDFLCPAILQNEQDIEFWRARIHQGLSGYAPQEFDLSMMVQGVGYESSYTMPPFELVYHGQDNRRLKMQYAALFKVSDDDLGCPYRQPRRDSDNRYRIGFLGTKNHEDIFIRFVTGLMQHLSPEKFTPVLVCHSSSLPKIQPYLNRPDVETVTFADSTALSIKKIKQANLDLIYFWEIGTDPLNYFLPFFRLAPVQCASWGAPETAGIPHVDYYISSELFETAGAAAHYSEQLVKISTLPAYYYRPPLSDTVQSRAAWQLSDDAHLYLCPQNLLKFHPGFDRLLSDILRRDSQGELILVKGSQSKLHKELQKRFYKTMPDVADRIKFIERQSYGAYLNLISVSDVILDPLYFGGGATSLDMLAMGAPIVTWPGEFMRGRMTYGFYQKIGVLDTVVWSAAEYVAKAVQIAADRQYQQYLRQKILAANNALFEDITAVREMERFFESAIEQHRSAV